MRNDVQVGIGRHLVCISDAQKAMCDMLGLGFGVVYIVSVGLVRMS